MGENLDTVFPEVAVVEKQLIIIFKILKVTYQKCYVKKDLKHTGMLCILHPYLNMGKPFFKKKEKNVTDLIWTKSQPQNQKYSRAR